MSTTLKEPQAVLHFRIKEEKDSESKKERKEQKSILKKVHNDDIERVGEQGLNNNSLYSSFVEVGSSAEKLRSKKVKPERSKSSRRVVTRSRSLVVRRSSTMVSPSKSASQDDSSERRSHSRSRSGVSPPRSESRSPNSSPQRYSRSRRSRSGSRRSRSPMDSSNRSLPRPSQTKGDRENPEPTKCIGIFGLNYKTTDADLHRAFSKFGKIEKVNVVVDGPSRRSRGFAFLYFETVATAKEAKEEMDGKEIDGFQIRVDFSITDSAHRPTPGVYFHHGKATRPSSRGRTDFRGGFRGRGDLRGRGGWRGGRSDYPPPGPPRNHPDDRFYDRRPPPPLYYESRDYRAYDKYEREYYDRAPSRHHPSSSLRDYPAPRDYPSYSRDYDRYYDPRDRYFDERDRYYEDRHAPPSRAYYDRPPTSRRDYQDPRDFERYDRRPAHSSRKRSRSPGPPPASRRPSGPPPPPRRTY